jgi:hypothetical protein
MLGSDHVSSVAERWDGEETCCPGSFKVKEGRGLPVERARQEGLDTYVAFASHEKLLEDCAWNSYVRWCNEINIVIKRCRRDD